MATSAGRVDSINQALKRVPVLPLYFVAMVPAALMFQQALSGTGGPDPVRALEHGLGIDAFKFMLASLLVTPLRERTGINLLRFRRMIGLTAFFYAVLHFGVWLVFDRQLQWAAIGADLVKRPYIIIGMIALVLLVPLALTSNNTMVSKLGAMRWRWLHMLAYPAAFAIALHYLWLVKSWTAQPLAYAAITVLLLSYRLLPKPKPQRARAASPARRASLAE